MRRPGPALIFILGLALFPITGCRMVRGAGEEFRGEDEPPPDVVIEEIARQHITVRDVRRSVEFLASDDLYGRGSPALGLERSAAWLADELYRTGLTPAGDEGGFLQYWPYEAAAPDADDGGERRANVVGRIPASTLTRAGEYVVLVAHYDHLGVGEPDEAGDSIYNGADDNASGVAALLQVARAFGALPQRPRRPLAFVVVSGSEEGLLGATRFARSPTVSLEEAVAVLNLDMIGRNDPDSIGVVGYGYSSLGPFIGDIAAATPGLGLAVTRDPDPGLDAFRNSDHFPFARQGIPAVRFFSGLHDDYHTPADEPDRLDYDKIARVARLVFLTAHRLADSALEPKWTEAGRAVIRP